MKIKNIIKQFLFHLLSSKKGYSDFKVLSGPAKGVKLRLDIRKEGSYWLGNYDQWIFDAVPLEEFLKAGDTAWDCGAYVGYYTAIFRKIVGEKGKVICFEASSTNFKRVQQLPAINNWENVQVLPLAVGPENTILKFVNNIGGSNGPFNLDKKYKEDESELEIEEVPSCGVDELIYSKGIAAPNFIKFDLESAEEFALHNGHRCFTEVRPVILLELHGSIARDAAGEFLEKYQYNGYLLHDVRERKNPITSLKAFKMMEIPYQIVCIPNKV